jgi:hypothetical protein
MESTSAHDLDRRLADLVRSERHLVTRFVIELAGFASRELYRELGYTSLFYYCVRQLGLSKSSAFRRSEVARLIARFPLIADRLTQGQLSIRALVELREVLTEENHIGVLARAEGMSQEQAQLLAVEYRPKPIPKDLVRRLPMPPAPLAAVAAVSAKTKPAPPPPEVVKPLAVVAAVSAETKPPPRPPEVVKPLTPELRRLNVTVTADFVDELEQVRVALSHKFPDGNFEQVVREAFKLVLERDRKRKALTDGPRVPTDEPRVSTGETPAPTIRLSAPTDQPTAPIDLSCAPSDACRRSEIPAANDRYVPAAVKRAVWERDQARCTWPMGDNLMKAERHLGRAFMAKFRTGRLAERTLPDR